MSVKGTGESASSGKAQAHHQSGDNKAKGFSEGGISSQDGGSPGDGTAQDMMKSPVGGSTGPVEAIDGKA